MYQEACLCIFTETPYVCLFCFRIGVGVSLARPIEFYDYVCGTSVGQEEMQRMMRIHVEHGSVEYVLNIFVCMYVYMYIRADVCMHVYIYILYYVIRGR
jgi:hypothetical protein